MNKYFDIECFTVGNFGTNLYLLTSKSSSESIVIDPGMGSEPILGIVRERNLKIKYIVNTHGHFDHVFQNSLFSKETGGVLCCHRKEADLLKILSSQGKSYGISVPESPIPDLLLEENDTLILNKEISFRVIHAPGHSPGSLCLYTSGFLFCGDVFFKDSIGRTDLPGGNYEELMDSIKNKILVLPAETHVFPGHGSCTTIGKEIESNPFLKENYYI